MAQLPIEPAKGTSKTTTPRFLRADLGDGFQQRSGDGIQTIKEEWSVSFVALDTTAANELVTFFEGLEGYKNFTWVPFRQESSKKFICTQWSESFLGNSLTNIDAIFEQVFDRQ